MRISGWRIKFAAIFALMMCGFPAQAQENKSQLATEINTQFPDNFLNQITPAKLRQVTTDMVNSWQQYTGVNAVPSTNYTFIQNDYGQLVTFNNAGVVAVALPQPIGAFSSFNVYASNVGTGSVTITPVLSTINGAATYTLSPGTSVWIISDGTNYQIFAGGSGGSGSGTVTAVSVVSANGFAGSVAAPTTAPAITISTSVTGILKGNGFALVSATAGTDYLSGTLATNDILQGNGSNLAAPVTLSAAIDAAIGSTQGDILYRDSAAWKVLAPGTNGYFLQTQGSAANPQWAVAAGTGSVTTVSVATANGFAGTVANPTTAPAITIKTGVTGILLGNGTAVSAASAGSDYLAPSGSGAALTGITWSQIGTTPTTLSGYGITDAISHTLTQYYVLQGNASNVAAGVTLSAALDAAIGSTQGNILYRGSTAWSVLAPGTSGYFLETQGSAANPTWAAASGGTGCNTGGSAGNVLTADGAGGCTTDTNTALTNGALSLGASGVLGSVKFGNVTTGTITLEPVTGALGTVTLLMPAANATLATTANIATALPSATSSQIYIGTGGAGVAAVASTLPTGAVPAFTGDVTNSAGSLATTVGKIGGNTVSLGGSFSTVSYGLTLTLSNTTNVTLPTSGTLATTTNIATALPSIATSQLYGGTGTAGLAQAVSIGSGLSLSGGTLSVSGGAGVTSLGNASADNTITLAGTGGGPYTGTVTAKLNQAAQLTLTGNDIINGMSWVNANSPNLFVTEPSGSSCSYSDGHYGFFGIQFCNPLTNQKRGIVVDVETGSSAGTINTTGILVSIYTPPDNGGDTSGIYVQQSGSGNAMSVYQTGGVGGRGRALEIGCTVAISCTTIDYRAGTGLLFTDKSNGASGSAALFYGVGAGYSAGQYFIYAQNSSSVDFFSVDTSGSMLVGGTTVYMPNIATGTPTAYACFDSTNHLIKSVSPCD